MEDILKISREAGGRPGIHQHRDNKQMIVGISRVKFDMFFM